MLSNIALIIMPFFCVWCFYAGFKLGKTERMPQVKIESPAKVIEKHKADKQKKEELERTNMLLRNIEVYDGSSKGQKKL